MYALLLFGSNVTATDTGLLYPDWPLMGGTPFPPITALSTPAGGAPLRRGDRCADPDLRATGSCVVRRGVRVRRASFLGAALGLFAVQCVIGALQIFTKLAPWTQTLHVAIATVIWVADRWRGRYRLA